MKRPSVLIIGAGVIGGAIARRLGSDYDITILEAKSKPGQMTSRLNSGVIHSGMHLPPQSLKARFAREGSQMIRQYCEEKNIPHRQCGMLVVASYAELMDVMAELKGFARVYRRGKQQDIGMRFIMPWNIKKLEPNVKAIGGLFAPSVVIIDQVKYVQSLFADAQASGAKVVCDAKVTKAEAKEGHWEVESKAGTFKADIVINAAGLYAHEISTLFGAPEYPVYFYRGEYYEVMGEDAKMVSRLVYPVYRLGSKGLGIHFTPTMSGRLLIGPNATQVDGPEDYETNKTPEDAFRQSVSRFCPQLKTAKLKWAFSGIRPKLSNDGTEADFLIKIEQDEPTFVNLLGIESPGLTSSMAIANYVAELLSSTASSSTTSSIEN
jgi:L-2-hydroxyglutarate oxidase LhgO